MKIRLIALYFLTASLASAANEFATLILNDADPAGSQQGLVEFRSVNGKLDIDLTAATDPGDIMGGIMPTDPDLGGPYDGQWDYPRLAYSCKYTNDNNPPTLSFAGPLLRVFPGDTVHIRFTNALFTQRTNIHFHGFNVSPHPENRQGLFGDFVNLPYVEAQQIPGNPEPGEIRTYSFTIPRNQPPGPYWYHAHSHGVAEMQVGCGLSGALYVEGAVPAYIKSFQDRSTPLANGRDKAAAAKALQTMANVATTLPQLPHHLVVLKDFWIPGLGPILGPLEQSVNGKVTYTNLTVNLTPGSPYVILYSQTDQVWEISNQSANLSYKLTLTGASGDNIGFYVLGVDGIPKPEGLSAQVPNNQLMIPPASRATVVVPTSLFAGATVNVVTQQVDTQGGDLYFQVGNDTNMNPNPWNLITVKPAPVTPKAKLPPGVLTQWKDLATDINTTLDATSSIENDQQKFIAKHQVDAAYALFEPDNNEPSPPHLPFEPTQFSFYRLADKHGKYLKGPSDAYDTFEPPIAHLTPGHPQRWIIQNNSLEWHTFHLHQAHFKVEKFTVVSPINANNPEANLDPPQENLGNPFYAVNEPPPSGSRKHVGEPYYSGEVDTVNIPNGLQVWLTVPMDEGPQIAGNFVMHCHILEHEDGGMMANVVAGTYDPVDSPLASRSPVHPPAMEVAAVKFQKPPAIKDATGADRSADIFNHSDFSLVTFGYTTCDGACPGTVSKCTAALEKLSPEARERVAPFFVSLDNERDNPEKLAEYGRDQKLSDTWKLLLDSKLEVTRAFGAQRRVVKRPNGEISIRHSTTVYLIDKTMRIRAAFDDEDNSEAMTLRIEKELQAPAPSGSEISSGNGPDLQKS